MVKAQRGILKNLKRNPRSESEFDSLLERGYMLELDSMSGVKEWTKDHGIRIPYKIFGILPHRYIPDFFITFLDGSQEIHETKGGGFLSWVSTHAKRRAADKWCKERDMKYRFIENSRGAMFGENRALDSLEKRSKPYTNLGEMLKCRVQQSCIKLTGESPVPVKTKKPDS